MHINSAKFIASNTENSKLPQGGFPELAFIGRSNVGKSSLINMLTVQKGLAKTSQTPGKTQTINHFLINGNWYLVDLPGYGFAKVSKVLRESWEKMIRGYLLKRETLFCVCVLIDARLTPQKNDLEFVEWLGEKQVPLCIIFTKCDKQSEAKTLENIRLFEEEMFKVWEALPPMFASSAEKKTGRDEILAYFAEILNL